MSQPDKHQADRLPLAWMMLCWEAAERMFKASGSPTDWWAKPEVKEVYYRYALAALRPVLEKQDARVAELLAANNGEVERRRSADRARRAAEDELAEAIQGPTYRHEKRGTSYRIRGVATAHAATRPIQEGERVMVYAGELGDLWVRGAGEFFDGRFSIMSGGMSERLRRQTAQATKGAGEP